MRTTTILLLASAAMACNDKGSTTDDTGTYVPVDADGDGFTDDVDCNDDDPEINPYAAELCDDIDNDCDGLIDDEDDAVEDASSFYSDADGDGYGDPDSETMACSQPDGLIEDNSDCDDLNYEISPGAEEICDDIDNDCDEEVDEDVLITFYGDSDGDGYGLEEESVEACEIPSGYAEMADDCDDTNSETYPGAEERCDDIDNDCDEEIDEEVLSIWYGDSDGDGYGDADAMIKNCDPPSGYVADNTDCDDAVQEINPGAEELCDDIDNDCDLAIDDEDDDVVDPNSWYLDSDSDGFGDSDTSTQSCDQPSSYVADNTDCDDDATDVNPDAAEVCDTIDNDCDGDIDDNDADVTDQGTWYADSDEDGYGDADNSTTTCEMPSGYVTDSTDCDDGDSAVNTAATEVCDDIDNDCDGDIDDDDADVSDQSTWYADSDEDGYGDADSTTEACEVPSGYVADTTDCDDGDSAVNTAATEVCDDIDNDCDGDIDDDDADVSDQSTWYADADEDGYGDADSSTEACDAPSGYVSDATDCDDAASDVSPGETEVCNDDIDNDCDGTTGTTDTGGVCENIDISLGDANLILLGVNASDTAGTSVAWLGDVDGDGTDDFAVGAPYEDSTASAAGSTYIMTQLAIDASSNETRSLADAKLQITGEVEADHSGQSMTGGDMNGDGFSDVWIGAPQEDTDGNGAGAA